MSGDKENREECRRRSRDVEFPGTIRLTEVVTLLGLVSLSDTFVSHPRRDLLPCVSKEPNVGQMSPSLRDDVNGS